MKRIMFITVVVLVSFCCVGAQEKAPDWDQLLENTDWNLYSKNLIKALRSDNLGLQASSMQSIIKYSNHVKVDVVVMDLIKMYRRHKNDRVRQLALVTINALQNDYAFGIIKRDYEFECCPMIKKTIAAIIQKEYKQTDLVMISDGIVASLISSDSPK